MVVAYNAENPNRCTRSTRRAAFTALTVHHSGGPHVRRLLFHLQNHSILENMRAGRKLPTFSRIFLFLVTIAVLPPLAVIGWAGMEHARFLEADVRTTTRHETQLLALIQETATASIGQTITTLAGLDAFRTGDRDTQEQILRTTLDHNPSYVNMAVTDASGIVTASPNLEVGTDLSERRHVQHALEGQEIAAGEFILAFVDRARSLPFAAPIRNEAGEITGTLTAVYYLEELSKAVNSFALPPQSVFLITDHRGIQLCTGLPCGTDSVGAPVYGEIWNGIVDHPQNAGSFFAQDPSGTRHFFSFESLSTGFADSPYLYLILGIPERMVQEPAQATLLRTATIVFISAFISLAVAGFVGNRLIGNKLAGLAATVTAIEKGNLQARTRISGGPEEVTRIGDAVDSMAYALEQRSLERDLQEQRLNDALQQKEALLQELQHRVKNNMQLILSMIHLGESRATEIQPFVRELEGRIAAMVNVQELLHHTESLSTLDLQSILARINDLNRNAFEASTVSFECEPCNISLERAIPIALITNELLTNAAKYAGTEERKPSVTVRYRRTDRESLLEVHDNGPGFPRDFDPDARARIGITLIRVLGEQIGATITFENDNGARVTVRHEHDEGTRDA